MNRSAFTTSISALVLLAGAAALSAGPLNPQAGPVGPSMKTLAEVEPRIAINAANTPGDADSQFKVTQPGSYYLTGNITGVAGKSAIKVEINNVTVDLNGFNVIGVPGSLDGVDAYPASRATVKNGTISSFGQHGVYVGGGGVVEAVVADHCGTGILTTQGCRVLRCSAIANTVSGIEVARYTSVIECLAGSNAGAGIMTTGAATVSTCTCTDNTNGIEAGYGATVDGCSCTDNAADGIQTATNCTLTGNNCVGNSDDGIQAGDNCTVQRNSCRDNGPSTSGAGIYLVGYGCTVEDNTVIGNHYGMLSNVSNGGNLIVKNRAHGNIANFNIAGGNRFATAVADPNQAGISPVANFAY